MERCGDRLARFLPHPHQYLLDEPLHVLLRHEGRFDVDLGELRLAIGPQVLIAEAARDLEVPVVARDHQQLLVDLRRLRQRVELALVHPARYEIVARPFGCGLGEDRGLDLEEAEVAQGAPRPLRETVAQQQAGLQLGAPKVEDPVLEPQLFAREFFAFLPCHRDGRRDGGTDDAQVGDVHLDVTRGERAVPGHLRTQPHRAFDQHDRLRPRRRRPPHHLGRRPPRVARQLHDPGAVAEVDEYEAAEVAAAVHPPAKSHRFAHLVAPQLAAAMRPHRRSRRRVIHHRICHMCHGPNVTDDHELGLPRAVVGTSILDVEYINTSLLVRYAALRR